MNRPAFGVVFNRLLWKEYRAIRGFWLGMAGLTVLFQVIMLALVSWNRDAGVASGIALVMPIFFVLGAAAIAYAVEQEDGTVEFLQVLSPDRRVLLLTKWLMLGLGTLALATLGAIFAIVFERFGTSKFSLDECVLFAGAALLIVSWGTYFSLRSQSALAAIWQTFASVTLTVIGFRFLADSGSLRLLSNPQHNQLLVKSILWVFAFLLLAFDVVLALRWPRNSIDRAQKRTKPRSAETTFFVGTSSRRPAAGEMRRLVWQEWQMAMRSLGWLMGASFLVLVAHPMIGISGFTAGLAAATIFALGCGVQTFAGEQAFGRKQFLGDRGVLGSRVWASKHVVWLGATLIAALPAVLNDFWLLIIHGFHIGTPMHQNVAWTYDLVDPALVAIWFMLTAYACGQASSMLIARGAAAVSVAVAAFLAALVWSSGALVLGTPIFWLAAPIPFVLMIVTWIRAQDWLIGRNTARGWAVVAAPIAIWFFGSIFATAIYRVYEVPSVPLWAVNLTPLPELPDSEKARETYLDVYAKLKQPPVSSRPALEQFLNRDSEVPFAIKLLELNEPQLDEAVAASKWDADLSGDGKLAHAIGLFRSMANEKAQRLELAGKPADAWPYRLAVLRWAAQSAGENDLREWLGGTAQIRFGLVGIQTWRRAKVLSPADLARAKTDVMAVRRPVPVSRVLMNEYVRENAAPAPAAAKLRIANRMMNLPTERARLERLSRFSWHTDLSRVTKLDEFLAENSPPPSDVVERFVDADWFRNYHVGHLRLQLMATTPGAEMSPVGTGFGSIASSVLSTERMWQETLDSFGAAKAAPP